MLAIRPQDLDIVRCTLRKNLPSEVVVWVFGSRANGEAIKRASDLDLLVDLGRKLSKKEKFLLEDDFEESDLPYRVDVVDWQGISEEFRAVVGPQKVRLRMDSDPT